MRNTQNPANKDVVTLVVLDVSGQPLNVMVFMAGLLLVQVVHGLPRPDSV